MGQAGNRPGQGDATSTQHGITGQGTGRDTQGAGRDAQGGQRGSSGGDKIETPDRPTTAPSDPNNPRPTAGQRDPMRSGSQSDMDKQGRKGIDDAVTAGFDDEDKTDTEARPAHDLGRDTTAR